MEVVNKNKVLLIIGIVFLLLLFVGGTFAYFSVNTTNTFGSTINTSLGNLGSVSLNSGSNLKIDLTAPDMMQMDSDKTYYASKDGMTETPTTEAIATAKAIGTGIFQCKYKLKVEDESTNSTYTAFQNMSTKSSNQIVLTINGKNYDFNTANLFPLTIEGTIANLVEGTNLEIKAGFKVINKKGVDQTALANTNLLLNFKIEEFSCTVTDEEIEPPTAIDQINTLASASEIAYDGTTDNNLRYIGANPNNYIYFNCNDYNNPTAETCEKWRIIGAFNNMKTSTGETKTLFKIIRHESLGKYRWDYKYGGKGSNDWEVSQLMLMLNGVSAGNYKSGYTVSGDYLLDKNNIGIMNISGSYYEGSSKTYIPAATSTNGYSSTYTVDFSNIGLKNDTTREMIENVVWKLGGSSSSYSANANGIASVFYSEERGTKVYSGHSTEWTGKIGLMYLSDYGYATSGGTTRNRESCLAIYLINWDLSSRNDCKNNDWLFMSSADQWLLPPSDNSYYFVSYVSDVGDVDLEEAYYSKVVRPTVYLTSDIVINGGEGSETNPYTLAVGAN